MSRRLLWRVKGFLFGLSIVLIEVLGGVFSALSSPSAMLDALLAPFSNEHGRRHLKYKMDKYYEGLTRESLQFQLRSALLDGNRQGFVEELRQASRKQNAIRRIFDDFAISDGQAGSKVWTEKQFAAFIFSRLRDGDSDAVSHLTRILWRCFCYNATYPFTDTFSKPEENRIDLDGWTQAIALLATDAVHNVGWNRAVLSLYGPSRIFESRKDCCWRRFVSFSISSNGGAMDAAAAPATDNYDWHPPDTLDEITRVAATQLPLPMRFIIPPSGEIRPRVQKLIGESTRAQARTSDFVIPYQDMLALLGAIMQVTKGDTTNGPTDDQSWPCVRSGGDRVAQMAAAKAILNVGGIHETQPVFFENHFAFSEKFHFSTNWPFWSFDQEITTLWRALFSIQKSNLPVSLSSQQDPPSVILQALDFLDPFEQNFFDRRRRRQSTKECSIDSESGLCRDKVLRALTWPFGSKLTVIYGTTTAASQGSRPATRSSGRNGKDGQPAIFAIITSSPLWCMYKTGKIDDFLVGDAHLLLELAPQPRALWYATDQMKYIDIVSTANDGEILFGHAATGADSSTCSSGIALNFNAGVATLRSSPPQGTGQAQGYVEIPVGPRVGPAKKVDRADAWETAVRIQKVEVYSVSGVPKELTVERPSRL